MPKSWFNIQARASGQNSNSADVSILGAIGDWGLTDADFISAVEAYGPVDEINLKINTRGGQVDHALGMFNYLLNHPAKVNVRVTGVAMSAGAIVALAGDKITMPANTIMMVHNPRTFAAGTGADLIKAGTDLIKVEQALMAVYKARTGKSEADLQAMLDEETFMTAEEAVKGGWADVVEPVSQKKKAASAQAYMAIYAEALSIPAEVLARLPSGEEQGDDEIDPTIGFTIEDGSGQTFWKAPAGTAQAMVDIMSRAALTMTDTQATAFLEANGYTATKADKPPKPYVVPTTMSAHIAATAAEFGLSDYAACFAMDNDLFDLGGVRAAMADAREVLDLCNLVGLAEQAAPLIRARTPLADARKTLQGILADRDEQTHTDSTRNPAPDGNKSLPAPVSATSIWAAHRAAAR